MKTYEFTIALADAFADEPLADKIYSICDDCTLTSNCDGLLLAEFDRESDSLDQAVVSAIDQLRSVGATTLQITIDSNSMQPA